MQAFKPFSTVLVGAVLMCFLCVALMGHSYAAENTTEAPAGRLVYSPVPTSTKNSSLNILAQTSVFEQQSKNHVIEVFLFDETPLRDILHMIAEMTGQNVVATPDIQDMPISLFLRNVTPFAALEVVCKNYNLWFTEQNGIVSVMTIDEYGRELTLRRDEQTAVFNLKYAPCITVAEAIANVFGTRVYVMSPEEVASYGHIGTDEYPEIGDEPDADVESEDTDRRRVDKNKAGNAFNDDDRTVMSTTLHANRYSPETILERQIGGARALMTMFPRNNSIVIRAVDTNLINDIADLVAQLDTPTKQLLLEVKVLQVALKDNMESFFNLSTKNSDSSIVALTSAAAAVSTGSTFSFGYLNSNISANLKLLETEGRVRSMNTPLMLVANNAAGKYFQGKNMPVRTGYTVTAGTISGESGLVTPGTVTTNYKEEQVGFTLEVAPSINEDRTVTLKIVAEISALLLGEGPVFSYNITGTGATQTGETDVISKTEIENIILGMDGQTLILGGLVEETLSNIEDKVPVLGDIPILNFFFKNTMQKAERTETVLLITPHIMMSPEEAQKVSNRVLAANSQHPYQTQGVTQLLEVDEATDMVKSTLKGKAGETPFPFNIGRAIRKLMHGNRTGGAIVELGV